MLGRLHQLAHILIFAHCPYQNQGIDDSGGCTQEEEEFPGETYLLPLGACHGEHEEASEAGGYQLPIECQVRAAKRRVCVALERRVSCFFSRFDSFVCNAFHRLYCPPPTEPARHCQFVHRVPG